jgi:hypothetical protein
MIVSFLRVGTGLDLGNLGEDHLGKRFLDGVQDLHH